MGYVILDKFPLGLVLDNDTEGDAVFDTIEEAEVEADNCQMPVIIDIGETYVNV